MSGSALPHGLSPPSRWPGSCSKPAGIESLHRPRLVGIGRKGAAAGKSVVGALGTLHSISGDHRFPDSSSLSTGHHHLPSLRAVIGNELSRHEES